MHIKRDDIHSEAQKAVDDAIAASTHRERGEYSDVAGKAFNALMLGCVAIGLGYWAFQSGGYQTQGSSEEAGLLAKRGLAYLLGTSAAFWAFYFIVNASETFAKASARREAERYILETNWDVPKSVLIKAADQHAPWDLRKGVATGPGDKAVHAYLLSLTKLREYEDANEAAGEQLLAQLNLALTTYLKCLDDRAKVEREMRDQADLNSLNAGRDEIFHKIQRSDDVVVRTSLERQLATQDKRIRDRQKADTDLMRATTLVSESELEIVSTKEALFHESIEGVHVDVTALDNLRTFNEESSRDYGARQDAEAETSQELRLDL